jgi:hypothetical protein
LPVSRRDIAASFSRRALGSGEADASDLALALAARRAQVGRLSDACHWSLERLGRLAEARSVSLILPLGGSPWEVPSAREALALAEAFAGAPVALAWDPGRLTAARALGLRLPDARVAAVAKAAGAAIESDAVGLEPGYLPGLGERDEALAPRPELPRDAPVVVTGFPHSTNAEIAGAVARVTALYEVEPREDEDDLLDEAEGREGDRRRCAQPAAKMPPSSFAMPPWMAFASGTSRSPRLRSTWTRAGSMLTRASRPLRETSSSVSPFHVHLAP